jgi:hypothetical protein
MTLCSAVPAVSLTLAFTQLNLAESFVCPCAATAIAQRSAGTKMLFRIHPPEKGRETSKELR